MLNAFIPVWVVEDFNRKPTALLLHAMTKPESQSEERWAKTRERLTESLEGLRVNTLDDYEKAQDTPLDLREILTTPPPLHLITRDEYKAAMGKTQTSHSYDARLRNLIGQHEGARDLRSVSAPGISADGRQALLYAEWHMGARVASGTYYLLEWRDGHWKVVDETMAWIS